MIRAPTLFVLGAGASKSYGLPLGSELRTLICEAQKESNPIARVLVQDGYFTHADIRDVALKFQRSNVRSIDEFLGRHSHLVDMGKALIAAAILMKENSADVFAENNSDHWHRLLWNKLIDETLRGKDLGQNKVRFLTFNYDRSLEVFLHESTKGAYGLSDSSAYMAWSSLPLMHVYGSVGSFSFADANNRMPTYGKAISPDEMRVAAAGINVIPEGRNGAEEFKTAREWFDWAEHVYILGFGFDRLNCERLGFHSVLQYKNENKLPAPSVVASVLDLTGAEVSKAKQYLLADQGEWTTHDANCTMTLRRAGLPD